MGMELCIFSNDIIILGSLSYMKRAINSYPKCKAIASTYDLIIGLFMHIIITVGICVYNNCNLLRRMSYPLEHLRSITDYAALFKISCNLS